MNEYEVTISYETTYVVSAKNEDMAIEQCWEWWDECIPNIKIKKIKKDLDN